MTTIQELEDKIVYLEMIIKYCRLGMPVRWAEGFAKNELLIKDAERDLQTPKSDTQDQG